MRWRKLGRIFTPDRSSWWTRNGYAFMPVADVRGGTIRVFYASLDERNIGRVGCLDLDARDPRRVIAVSAEPVLDVGELGAFDDCGVTPSCVVTARDTRLYYIGWQRCERVPHMLFTGLAAAEPGSDTFRRVSRVPVLDRIDAEPFSRSAPCVRVEDGGIRAWYWTCDHWSQEGSWVHYNTTIRHARSTDGVQWTAGAATGLAPAGDDEYAVGRPWVLVDGGVYRMWYSIRCRGRVTYRIGYAESRDGLAWTRRDQDVGIAPSAEGWDSEMICHPCVVDAAGQRLMFYNGNRHGADGFGCAVLERD